MRSAGLLLCSPGTTLSRALSVYFSLCWCLSLKTNSKSYENAPGWAGISPPPSGEAHRCKYCYCHPAGHQDEKLSQTWCVSKEWFISRTSHIRSPFVHRFNRCNKTRTSITLCYCRIYQLPCQGEVRQCLAETRYPFLAHLGVIHFIASWPQTTSQGTPKSGKDQDTGAKAVISSLHSKHQIAWVAMSGTSQPARSPNTEGVLLRSCTPHHKHQSMHAKRGSAGALSLVTGCFEFMAAHEYGNVGSLCCFWWTEWQEPPITVINIFSHAP